MKTVIVFLADGFEECEGLLAVDLLRRAKVNVVTASVSGRREVLSSHQVTVTADLLAEETVSGHPGFSTSTVRLTREDMLRYVNSTGHEPTYVDLPREIE